MADYADGISKRPPPELQLAWRCREWRCLPRAGGIEDQDLATWVRMETAERIFQAYKLKASLPAPEFADKHQELAAICFEIDEWRDHVSTNS